MRGLELGGGYPALDEPGGDLPDPLVGVLGVAAEQAEGLWLPGLSMSRRRELGRQWCAFMAAWRPEVPAR
jgi:hypothetical protein